MIQCLALLVVLFGVATRPAQAQAQAPLPQAAAQASAGAPGDESKQAEALRAAALLLQAHLPEVAIETRLDKIIAYYEAAYLGSNKLIYCARSQVEAVAYMVLAGKLMAAPGAEKTEAVALRPIWAEAYYLKGYALMELGRFGEAKTSLDRALELSPLHAGYWSELGQLHLTQRNWELALATFDKASDAAEYSPSSLKVDEQSRAWRGKGFAYIELGRLDEAESMYRRSLALNPQDRVAPRELGHIQALRQKVQPKSTD